MTKLLPEHSKSKFEDHLKQIKKLQKLDYKIVKKEIDPLSQKIRSLINLSFDDSKSKLERFEKTPFYIVSTGMTEQEKEQNSRDYYQRSLQMMENNVVGFLEELNLIIDTNKQSTKLSKIEGKIEEEKLEAKRRKAVVETKVHGAEIEIITILREELKRRGENTKVIAELNSKISRIEDTMTQFQKQKDTIKTVPSDNENQEDRYLNDIVKKTEDAIYSSIKRARKDAKKHYSQIKILKDQIRELQNDLPTASLPEEVSIKSKVNLARTQISVHLQRLTDIWSEYS